MRHTIDTLGDVMLGILLILLCLLPVVLLVWGIADAQQLERQASARALTSASAHLREASADLRVDVQAGMSCRADARRAGDSPASVARTYGDVASDGTSCLHYGVNGNLDDAWYLR